MEHKKLVHLFHIDDEAVYKGSKKWTAWTSIPRSRKTIVDYLCLYVDPNKQLVFALFVKNNLV